MDTIITSLSGVFKVTQWRKSSRHAAPLRLIPIITVLIRDPPRHPSALDSCGRDVRISQNLLRYLVSGNGSENCLTFLFWVSLVQVPLNQAKQRQPYNGIETRLRDYCWLSLPEIIFFSWAPFLYADLSIKWYQFLRSSLINVVNLFYWHPFHTTGFIKYS